MFGVSNLARCYGKNRLSDAVNSFRAATQNSSHRVTKFYTPFYKRDNRPEFDSR